MTILNKIASHEYQYDEEIDIFLKSFDLIQRENEALPSFEELDKYITQEEIKQYVKNLARNKSPGRDNLLNEYFIECIDLFVEPIEIFFNEILNSVFFPSHWIEGILIPLHKKGSTEDTNNYRGITLISCLGKLFTSVINQRLIKWSTENDISTDTQFGFKSGHSTVDAIFVLQNLITLRKSKNCIALL